jgi:hypothetical protein
VIETPHHPPGKEITVLQSFVRWITSVFRPSDPPSEEAEVEPDAPAAPRWRLWLRRPLQLRIFGTRPSEDTATVTEFSSVEQPDWDGILDSLFWSGYTGTGNPEEMLQRLRKMQDTAVDATRVEYFLCETALREKLDSVAEERRQDRIDEPGVRALIGRLQEERGQGMAGVHWARERLLSAYARLAALRHGFAVRQIEERIRVEAELSQTLAKNVAATEEVRCSAEDSLVSRELSRREKAGPVLAEWEAGHEARVRIIRDHSERQGRIVASLRASGMTERVAGFFVWAGYVAMVIFGWRLGEVLHERAFPNSGSLHGLIAPLAQTAYRTFLTVGTRDSLLAIGAFIGVWLLGSFLIFFLYDQGLFVFDPRWDEEKAKRKAEAKARKEAAESAAKGRAESTRKTPSRSPDLTYRGILHFLDGSREVSRGDYSGFLARIPLLAVPALLGLLALLFFAMGGQSLNSTPEFVNPINSFLFALFGFAMAAVFTGCVALLLQPLITLRAAAPGPSSRWALATPVLGLAAMVFLTLLFSGAVPNLNVWGPGSLAGPVLLLVVNALMLSHGLVYRHLFRDWRALRKEASRLETEHWKMSPYSIFQLRDLKPHTLFERWNGLHQELRDAWKAQDAAHAQVLEDLPQPSSRPSAAAASRPAPVPAAAPGARAEPETAKPAGWDQQADEFLRGTRVTVLDGRLEPELTSEVMAARAAYHDAREALEEVNERLAETTARLEEIEGSRLDDRHARLEGDLKRLTAERAASEAEVEARYAALCQEGASAHEGGRQLAERLARVTSGTIRL